MNVPHHPHRSRAGSPGPFDEAIKTLRAVGKEVYVPIPMEPDAKGYIDRECPANNCSYQFKVNIQDWNQQISNMVYCPMCRTNKESKHWWTKEQLGPAGAHAKQHLEQMIFGAFARDAEKFNRSAPRGLISISMEVTVPKKEALPPVPSSDAYRIEIQCEHCRFRFSVLGSAFFCPCCGRSSVERVFDQSLSTMRAKIEHARQFRETLTGSGKPDVAVDMERSLIESCITDCVTAFQCLCDALWILKRPLEKSPKNAFQNLQKGSLLWKGICGEGYEDWLPDSDLRRLIVFFQRRHLLAHCHGIVDQDYLDKSSDCTYAKGQRIVVSVNEADEMVRLVEELVMRLRSKLASSP